MSVVKLSKIYVEDVFEWLYNHVISSGGDGSGAIVCGNYKEAADNFIKWHKKKYNKEFHLDRHDEDLMINFHDSNESFVFSCKEIDWCDGDYVFVIENDCHSFDNSVIIKTNKEME